MENNIKTLIFDLGGVLLNIKSEEDWFRENFAPYFKKEEALKLKEQGLFNTFEKGQISPAEFRDILRKIAIKPISDQEFDLAWNKRIDEYDTSKIEKLFSLNPHYRLFLLSNTNQIHQDYFLELLNKQFGKPIFDELFEQCFYSHELGLRKPGREIYEFVLEKIQANPLECAFFDDTMINLEQPEKMGIKTFWIHEKQTVLTIDFNRL